MSNDKGEILFQYSGHVYFRPIGRGICLRQPIVLRGNEISADQLQLEDLFDGDYEMEVVIRRRLPVSSDEREVRK